MKIQLATNPRFNEPSFNEYLWGWDGDDEPGLLLIPCSQQQQQQQQQMAIMLPYIKIRVTRQEKPVDSRNKPGADLQPLNRQRSGPWVYL
mmetsp:Transcript_23040/g.45746  ORF Transcript_23040/g.45746 Transcript_23040/m.45746 type:complete len:90 (+) Transcript_23040:62-331(+)